MTNKEMEQFVSRLSAYRNLVLNRDNDALAEEGNALRDLVDAQLTEAAKFAMARFWECLPDELLDILADKRDQMTTQWIESIVEDLNGGYSFPSLVPEVPQDW